MQKVIYSCAAEFILVPYYVREADTLVATMCYVNGKRVIITYLCTIRERVRVKLLLLRH